LMQLSRSLISEVHLVPHGRAIHIGTNGSAHPSGTCAGLADSLQVVESFRYLLTDRCQFDILQSSPGWRGPNAIRPIETARPHHAARRRGGRVAARGGAQQARCRQSRAAVTRLMAASPTTRLEPADWRPPSPRRPGHRTERIEVGLLFVAQGIVEFRKRRLHGLHRGERGVEPLLHGLRPAGCDRCTRPRAETSRRVPPRRIPSPLRAP